MKLLSSVLAPTAGTVRCLGMDPMKERVPYVRRIGEFFHTLARQLSLGQKMRADIALMLLHEPEILFLDEPTIGLDVLAKRNILDFIKTLSRERGVTVMLTSHDMDELEQLAGRIVMIDRGRIDDVIADLYEHWDSDGEGADGAPPVP